MRRYGTATRPRTALPGDEGAFLACSFWLADALVLDGQVEAGRALFERLLALRNDVGPARRGVRPGAGRQLGNVPQAYSHLALVNSALNLARSRRPATTPPPRSGPTATAERMAARTPCVAYRRAGWVSVSVPASASSSAVEPQRHGELRDARGRTAARRPAARRAGPAARGRSPARVGPAVGPGAECDPRHAVEPPGPQQLGQHGVDPVRRLGDVLENHDAAAAGRDSAVPTVLASSASVPPTSTPRARPGTSQRRPPSATHPDALRLEQRRAQRARRVSASAADRRRANVTVAAIGPKRVASPSRLATAWCSTVASLKPTSTRGPAARIASQSSRSTHPGRPRPAAGAEDRGAPPGRTRRAGGPRPAARPCRRGAAARSSACAPTTTSRPQDSRVATPRASRPASSGPLGATTATRSPRASRRGRSRGRSTGAH